MLRKPNVIGTLLVTLFAIGAVVDSVHADVRVRKVGSNLIITGDREDNFVFVEVDTAFGVIFVSAVEEAYSTDEIKKISIRTLGGNDVVEVYQYDLFIAGALARADATAPLPLIDLDINTAVGDDDVYVSGDWGKTRIITSGGEDLVDLSGGFGGEFEFEEEPTPTSFRDLYVSTGGNDDTIYMDNILVGYSAEPASNDGIVRSRVLAGSGNDEMFVYGYATIPGASGRVVRTQMSMGGGDDELQFTGVLQERDYLNGGGGRLDCLGLDLVTGSAAPNDVIIRGFEEDCDEILVLQ